MLTIVADIDECELDSRMCLNGVCKNTMGSYNCECEIGYSMKPGQIGCTGMHHLQSSCLFHNCLLWSINQNKFILHIDNKVQHEKWILWLVVSVLALSYYLSLLFSFELVQIMFNIYCLQWELLECVAERHWAAYIYCLYFCIKYVINHHYSRHAKC